MALTSRLPVAEHAVSTRQMEAAQATLADLTREEHDELDGHTRDEIGHIIYVLDQIIERRIWRPRNSRGELRNSE